MSKLIALRWTLPTIVVVAVVTLAIIAVTVVTGTHGTGTAWGIPQ